MSTQYNTTRRILRLCLLLGLVVTLVAVVSNEAFAQRGRGGGGRRTGGYSGGRPSGSYNRTPSMSRPTTPTTRSRPSTANRPATDNRVGAGNRPTTGNRSGAANRSEALNRAGQGQRVSSNDLNNFLNSSGNQGGQRGSRAQNANSAVSDFLSQNASTQPTGSSLGHQRSENISNRTDARSDLRSSRGENRDFASDNRQERLQDRGDRQAARVTNRGDYRASLAAGRGDRQTERQVRRGEAADQIRSELEDHYGHDHLFDDFWDNHPDAHYYFHKNPVFWTWATVGTMRALMPWNWGASGGGGSYSEAYYDDGTVYAGDEQIPAEEYAEQAETIVQSAPEVEEPENMEWLPLGVFALTQDENSTAVPNMFLQLAVSKEGIIAGTYQNKETGDTASVEGMVDPKSKRAAWTIVGKNTPIMETEITNLTKNETGALLHFADGQTQQWMMLHIENPDVTSEAK